MQEPTRSNEDEILCRTLRKYFGHEGFRPHQINIIKACLQGKDVFVLMSTGAGKSLCYQIPALIPSGLPTIVISPLISLMEDQVLALTEKGIPACSLSQATSVGCSVDAAKIFYLSPEKLESSISFIRDLVRNKGISCFAIDECHCISEWGHDFRPSYRSLTFLREEFPNVPIMALTATATHQTVQDVVRNLRMNNPVFASTSFNRPNLYYEVRLKSSAIESDLTIDQIGSESCIIYTLSKREADEIANFLRNNLRIMASSYHAGLSNHQRAEVHHAFVRDEIQCVVATVAFGMGIDKPDIRKIIHYGVPKNLETYYQQTGRAGRDGAPGSCTLFWATKDFSVEGYFVNHALNRIAQNNLQKGGDKIREYVSSNVCRRKFLLAYFGEIFDSIGCKNCDICNSKKKLEPVDFNVEAKLLCEALHETGERFGLGIPIDVLMGSHSKQLMEKKFRGVSAQELKTFNVSKKSKKWWSAFAQMMEVSKVIEPFYSAQYRLFRLTALGKAIREGKSKLAPIVPTEALRKLDGEVMCKSGDWISKSKESVGNCFEVQFLSLRRILTDLRRQLASERNLPPYVIFSETALEALVKFLPCSVEEMQIVPDLSKLQMERYGEVISAEISKWRKTHEELSLQQEKTSTINPSTTASFIISSPSISNDSKLVGPLKPNSRIFSAPTPVVVPLPVSSSKRKLPSISGSGPKVQKITEKPNDVRGCINSYMLELWYEFSKHGSLPKLCESRMIRLVKAEDILSKCILSGKELPLSIMGFSLDQISNLEQNIISSNPSIPAPQLFKTLTLAQIASAAKISGLSHNDPNSSESIASWELNLIKSEFQRKHL